MERSIVTGKFRLSSPGSRPPREGARLLRESTNQTRALRVGSRAGWTLVELVIVMSIITVLAAMAMTVHTNSLRLGKEAVLREDLFRMRDAIDQYYADKQRYPADLQSLVTDGYLRAVPVDPVTNSADTWQTIPAEPDPSNPSAEPGVFNVKSGADGTSLMGQPFTDF
jgi:general secretion pathway protein G